MYKAVANLHGEWMRFTRTMQADVDKNVSTGF